MKNGKCRVKSEKCKMRKVSEFGPIFFSFFALIFSLFAFCVKEHRFKTFEGFSADIFIQGDAVFGQRVF